MTWAARAEEAPRAMAEAAIIVLENIVELLRRFVDGESGIEVENGPPFIPFSSSLSLAFQPFLLEFSAPISSHKSGCMIRNYLLDSANAEFNQRSMTCAM